MPRSGLNIATQAGEGDAAILNWGEFDNTVNQIYARDAANQKSIQAENAKMNIKMGDASKGLRPADMAKFKQGYDKYMEASTMLESKQIMNNPHQQAYWKQQQEEAFYDNMALAQQSADATKRQADTWSAIAAHPELYKSFDELKGINEAYNNASVETLKKLGLDNPTNWMHPADTIPRDEIQKTEFGATKTSTRMEPVVDDKTGIVKGNNVITQEYSEKSPREIAMNTSKVLDASYTVAQQAKQNYNYDVANDPDNVQKTMDRAQQLLDDYADKNNLPRTKLDNSYVGYDQANNVINGQPRDVGAKNYVETQDWKDYQQKLKLNQVESFEMGKAKYESGLREQEATYKHWLNLKNDTGLDISGTQMYDAAQHPNQMYGPFPVGKNQQANYTGTGLLNKRMSEIMSKIPKNYDYVIINRQTLLNKDMRRNILDKLFGNTADTKDFYDLQSKSNDDALQQMITKLNKELHTSLTMNDLNSSTVIIKNQDKGTITPIMTAGTNYDGWIGKIGQMLQQDKPKGNIDDDGSSESSNTGILNALSELLKQQ